MSMYLSEPHIVTQAYKELRGRLNALLGSVDAQVGDVIVPHCPAWTVKMTLSHLVGVAEDGLSGNMRGVTTERWTNAQVERHRDDSLADLLEKWNSLSEEIDQMVPRIPAPLNSQLVMDSTSHEHDIRKALRNTDARDSLSVEVAAGFMRNLVAQSGHVGATKILNTSMSSFDFLRCLSGRRSSEQIEACGLDSQVVAEILENTPMSIPPTLIEE